MLDKRFHPKNDAGMRLITVFFLAGALILPSCQKKEKEASPATVAIFLLLVASLPQYRVCNGAYVSGYGASAGDGLPEEQVYNPSLFGSWGGGSTIESHGIQTVSAAKWPGKIVYYTIDSALPSPSRVTSAIAHWQSKTQITFQPRTAQVNYVTFRKVANVCQSNIGVIGGQQFVDLDDNCGTGTVVHEIGHAVGLNHEHQRTDRDTYVTINLSNVESGKASNFTMSSAATTSNYGAYDFDSIMHYNMTAFSSNGQPTITRKDGSSYSTQQFCLSPGDVSGVASIYGY